MYKIMMIIIDSLSEKYAHIKECMNTDHPRLGATWNLKLGAWPYI